MLHALVHEGERGGGVDGDRDRDPGPSAASARASPPSCADRGGFRRRADLARARLFHRRAHQVRASRLHRRGDQQCEHWGEVNEGALEGSVVAKEGDEKREEQEHEQCRDRACASGCELFRYNSWMLLALGRPSGRTITARLR